MAKALTPLLFVLTICQANFLFGDAIGPQADDSNEISYRLPRDFVPSHYDLNLNVDLDKFTFEGTVAIKIKAQNNIDKVVLNAKNLNISEAALTKNNSATSETVNYEGPNKQEFLIVNVKPGTIQKEEEYVLRIKYSGTLNDQNRGFYRSRYITEKNDVKYVAATHFEPTGARLAFPCWDEPEYKATFIITLTNKKSYTAISNMPAKPETPNKEPGETKTTVFEETKKMSTYLVAFVVSDYAHTKNENATFRVWTKPHAVKQTQYALETGEKLLKKLSEYTGMDYVNYMPKMDQVTLKDFSPSAMENWGLVTYRESALLFEENVTSIRSKQSITTIIAHEFAHQWFGNLVSPKWWSYVWLNEGFANYFQYFITHEILPNWRLNETFVVDNTQGNAFVADAAENVRPMNKEVDTPQEISNLFDSIAYQKAGSVIRMMSHILTEKVFQDGLREYLKTKKLSVADSKELLEILDKTANKKWEDKTFVEIMDAWVNKPGYPVVNVISKDGKLELSQERFTLHGRKNDNDWWIPLTYVKKSDNPNFENTTVVMWLKPGNKSETIDHKKEEGWIIFNNLQTGYYRVNYHEDNWKLLTNYLKSKEYKKIHVINRAQLIDDALNLARSNRLPYETALSLTLYLKQETDYVPWQTTFKNLNFLQKMLSTSEKYGIFKDYVKYIMTKLTEVVKYEPQKDDDDLIILLRTNAMKWACRADVNDCTKSVQQKYQQWLNNDQSKLDIDMKNNILCAGIRSADESAFNKTLDRLKSIGDEDERKSSLSVLACSDSSERWKQFLLMSLENADLVSFNSAVQSVVSEHPESVDIVLNILENKYDQIKKLNNSDDVIKSCINAIGGTLLTPDQFITLSTFMSKGELKPELFQTTLQTATRNMEWARVHSEGIEKWLVANKNTFNSANSLTFASFLLLLSIFITRYY